MYTMMIPIAGSSIRAIIREAKNALTHITGDTSQVDAVDAYLSELAHAGEEFKLLILRFDDLGMLVCLALQNKEQTEDTDRVMTWAKRLGFEGGADAGLLYFQLIPQFLLGEPTMEVQDAS